MGTQHSGRPRVVIIGGGFAGLTCARGLARAPVEVTLIDRRNHHVFQPLLYQVATAMLSPADISAPIRRVVRHQRNTSVVLGEVHEIDPERRVVVSDAGEIAYDILVLGAGARPVYFGHDEWAKCAPGLKTVEDALEIRREFLLAFERAETARDEDERRRELTFVIVGAGPTGVELAGAMIEIAREVVPRDFRNIDTRSARVVLIEAGDRVLPGFPARNSEHADRDLRRMGVELRLASPVTEIDERGVAIEDERIEAGNVIWAAGVEPSPLTRDLGTPLDDRGRVEVEPDLSVPGHPEIFAVGDLARVVDSATGEEVPGMAPGAMQMGRHIARLIVREARSSAGSRRPFEYRDKGTLATIGRGRAVATVWGRAFSGWPAWLVWALVHVFYLIGFRNRFMVMLEWAWAYVTYKRGARLITGEDSADEGVGWEWGRSPRQ